MFVSILINTPTDTPTDTPIIQLVYQFLSGRKIVFPSEPSQQNQLSSIFQLLRLRLLSGALTPPKPSPRGKVAAKQTDEGYVADRRRIGNEVEPPFFTYTVKH